MTSILPSLPSGARILIIRLRSIGDIILLTPALRLLKEWRPDLAVSVVIERRFRELLEGNPDVSEILEPGSGDGVRKLASRLAAVREIRRRHFAVCVNLHGGPTSTLLTRLSGARTKVGFHHYRSRAVYDVLVPDARQFLGQERVHTAELQAAAFYWLGLPRREIPRARLAVPEEACSWWRETRTKLGLSGQSHYAILHPMALYATKQWAPENFARLGSAIETELGVAVVYCCGPGESPTLDAVERAAPESISRGARIRRLEGLSFSRFAAALQGARLFVGNDSGPAHMAAALGRPLVVVFGSSSSPIWGPWPRQDPSRPARVVQNFYDCNPCPGDRCYRFARPECILSVSFEQVRAAVQSVWEESRQKVAEG